MCISGSLKMNWWLCFLAVFFIGSTSGNQLTQNSIPEEDILNGVTKAFVQFDRNFDEFIDWVSFDKLFQELLYHSDKYSIWNIGDVRMYFLQSKDYYLNAVSSVYGWCCQIDILMPAYLQLFHGSDPNARDIQRNLTLNSLEIGVEEMKNALDNLDKSREHMSTGIRELSNVMYNISEIFKNDQNDYLTKIAELNERVHTSFERCLILGILDLFMVEVFNKPEIRRNFEKLEYSFNVMKTRIIATIDKANIIKQRLWEEYQHVQNLLSAAKANKVILRAFKNYEAIIDVALNLIFKCKNYEKNHGPKH